VGNDAAARPQLIEQIADFRRIGEEAARGHLPITIYGRSLPPRRWRSFVEVA
jgi:hypothetical protein